jgi:OOP family OmpA-OmpF porin
MSYFSRFVFITCFCGMALPLLAQTPKTYTDSKGKSIQLPLGELNFADEVIQFSMGNPMPQTLLQANSKNALNSPDFKNDVETPYTYLSLGCGGSVTLYFANNVLSDGLGNDLYVFEAGQNMEGVKVEVSTNGILWYLADVAVATTMGIDIAPIVKNPNDYFRYVRLTDTQLNCDDFTPGADIDALAAINGSEVLSFNSKDMFFEGSLDFSEAAPNYLRSIADAVTQHQQRTMLINIRHAPDESPALNNERGEAIKSFLLDYMDDPDRIKIKLIVDEKWVDAQKYNKYYTDIDVFFAK